MNILFFFRNQKKILHCSMRLPHNMRKIPKTFSLPIKVPKQTIFLCCMYATSCIRGSVQFTQIATDQGKKLKYQVSLRRYVPGGPLKTHKEVTACSSPGRWFQGAQTSPKSQYSPTFCSFSRGIRIFWKNIKIPKRFLIKFPIRKIQQPSKISQ